MKYDDIDIFENDIKGYSLGGSISGDIRELQGRPESEDLFTPAQAAWFASQLAPGTGLLDVSRGTPAMPSSEADPSEFYSGELQGTLAENLARGNNLESAFQILGGLGDLAYGIPVAGVVAGPALKGLSVAGRAGLKSLRSGDGKLIENLQPEDISTGQPVKFKYSKNKEQAPQMGATYAQDVEPSGRYMISGKVDQEGWETGVQEFNNPLVLDWGKGSYQDSDNWKQVLSANYGGRTGSDLSDAIKADGYDGIITVINTKTSGGPQVSEIVDLKNQGGLKSLTAADEPLKAFHSSPHDFNKFILEKIGTGEGAQAYGWGLYFAENPEVAKYYREAFEEGSGGLHINDKKIDEVFNVDIRNKFPELYSDLMEEGAERIRFEKDDILDQYLDTGTDLYDEASDTVDELIQENMKDRPDIELSFRLQDKLRMGAGLPDDEVQRIIDLAEEVFLDTADMDTILGNLSQIQDDSQLDIVMDYLNPKQKEMFNERLAPKIEMKGGEAKTYEVDLKVNKDKLLDWDEPLMDQPEVLEKIKSLFEKEYGDSENFLDRMGLLEGATGGEFYETITDYSPEKAKAFSERLRDEVGIDGIKYADGFTRRKDGSSKNFVIFDPRLIEITKQYGIPIGVGAAFLAKMDQAKEELDTNNVDIFN